MDLALALTRVMFILLQILQRACNLVKAVLIASQVARGENVVLTAIGTDPIKFPVFSIFVRVRP